MSEIVHILWQSALILIAICVILFFLPIAMKLLQVFIVSIFNNSKE